MLSYLQLTWGTDWGLDYIWCGAARQYAAEVLA
jgi:hypothetical protein